MKVNDASQRDEGRASAGEAEKRLFSGCRQTPGRGRLWAVCRLSAYASPSEACVKYRDQLKQTEGAAAAEGVGGARAGKCTFFFNAQTLRNGGRGGGGGQGDGKREDPDPANAHIPAITVKD